MLWAIIRGTFSRRCSYWPGSEVPAVRFCETRVMTAKIAVRMKSGIFSRTVCAAESVERPIVHQEHHKGQRQSWWVLTSERRGTSAESRRRKIFDCSVSREANVENQGPKEKKAASSVFRSLSQGIGSTVRGCRPKSRPTIAATMMLPKSM